VLFYITILSVACTPVYRQSTTLGIPLGRLPTRFYRQEPNQHSDFKDFHDTKPSLFKEAEEPLQANEWLNTIVQKFCLLRLTNELKTEYASYQLYGPAGIWWSHYRSMLPPNVPITWDQFKVAFHGNYIPLGLMAMKHTKFMRLTQGNKSLIEYLQAFNNIARYATEFVDTDAKKIVSFKRGLSPKLMKTLGTSKWQPLSMNLSVMP
jgi:hypothetical protein